MRSTTRGCITCRHTTAKPKSQVLGQLPVERITLYDHVGLDYAGPFTIKYGSTRKPTLIKAYVCFCFAHHQSCSLGAGFGPHNGCICRHFTSNHCMPRQGLANLGWSWYEFCWCGAWTVIAFFQNQKTEALISEFCATQNITWKFIPERTPHFGGLRKAAVKSMKTHLKKVVGETKLTFEEFATILAQVEACSNSTPLVPLPCTDDVTEPLTPGHFLIGWPLEALPDPSASYLSVSLLRRWHLSQHITRHLWKSHVSSADTWSGTTQPGTCKLGILYIYKKTILYQRDGLWDVMLILTQGWMDLYVQCRAQREYIFDYFSF